MAKKRMVMVIDVKRCLGCHTCAVACKSGNYLPNKVWWNRILTVGGKDMDTPEGVFPNLKMGFLPISCQHCENPACVKACPVGATYKREDGVVMQDYDRCIGCQYCIAACPYTEVRQFNVSEPEYYLPITKDIIGASAQQKGTVSKCIFCFTRLDDGKVPNCMELCPGRARYFGDLNDPASEVAKLLQSRQYNQLLVEKGTKPSVYYLT